MNDFVDAFNFFFNNLSLIGNKTVSHLEVSFASVGVALIIGVNEVDQDAVQAARAMGMTALQVLWRVELPMAMPLIFAGIRTATVYVVATATLATFAGGGGLGDIIVNEPTYGTAGVIAGSLTITVLAFLIDGILALVQYAVTPRPLRRLGRATRTEIVVEPSWDTGVQR